MRNEVLIRLIDVDPSGTRYCGEFLTASISLYDDQEDELYLNDVSIIGFVAIFERAFKQLNKWSETKIYDIYQTIDMKLNIMGKFVIIQHKKRNFKFHSYFILKSLESAKTKLYEELLENLTFKQCLDQDEVFKTLFLPLKHNGSYDFWLEPQLHTN